MIFFAICAQKLNKQWSRSWKKNSIFQILAGLTQWLFIFTGYLPLPVVVDTRRNKEKLYLFFDFPSSHFQFFVCSYSLGILIICFCISLALTVRWLVYVWRFSSPCLVMFLVLLLRLYRIFCVLFVFIIIKSCLVKNICFSSIGVNEW